MNIYRKPSQVIILDDYIWHCLPSVQSLIFQLSWQTCYRLLDFFYVYDNTDLMLQNMHVQLCAKVYFNKKVPLFIKYSTEPLAFTDKTDG
jgi:hypothetical protein